MVGGQTDCTVNARSSLLPPLVSACPNLTHLCLFAKESLPWNDILFAISAISHWSSLRHLAAHFPAVWDPQLIEYENSMENPSMPVIGFTKLEHLDIISTVEFSIKLFHCMSQAHLQTLRVESSNDLETHQWSELFKAVQQGISCSSLQHIHISRNHENIISASITFEALSPLLTFTCLTQVIIINHGFDLDDENLQIMASAWTCLQALVLITLNPRHSQPRITINGLVSLVQHCPSLVDLTIAFDASQAYLRAEGGARSERIHTLGVSHSPIGDLDKVAALLSDMFPNLCFINVCQCWLKGGQLDHIGDRDAWKEVESRCGYL